MQTNQVSLEIITPNGNKMTEYAKDGKNFIEGRPSNEYKIRIKNNTWNRILCVVSVDGLDVIDGKPADFNSPGYVLGPYQTHDIEGWRTSNEQVRKFYFTSRRDSYSNKVGEGTQNLGVIGLAAFNEIVYNSFMYAIPTFNYLNTDNSWKTINNPTTVYGALYNSIGKGLSYGQDAITASCSAQSFDGLRSTPKNSLGTGMGETTQSIVTNTTFNRISNPFAKIEFYYFECRELEKMGIIIRDHKQPNKLPEAFPRQYCKQV